MGTNNVAVKIFDDPEAAPVYREPEYHPISIEEFIIVNKGTVEGGQTVDFILMDPSGKKYVAMITGNLIEMLVSAMSGAKAREG